MSGERFNQAQDEINTKLEKLKSSNNPAQRRDLMVALRQLLTEIDKLVANGEWISEPVTDPLNLAEIERMLGEAEVALRADFREPYDYERRQRLVEDLKRVRNAYFELLKKQKRDWARLHLENPSLTKNVPRERFLETLLAFACTVAYFQCNFLPC
jgi:hypothetical protein